MKNKTKVVMLGVDGVTTSAELLKVLEKSLSIGGMNELVSHIKINNPAASRPLRRGILEEVWS